MFIFFISKNIICFSGDLLHGLSEVATRLDIPIQTHLAENKQEIEVLKIFQIKCIK